MTTNNIILKKRSGRNVHRFLMKESFRYFKEKGYKIELEKRVKKGFVDVYATKNDEIIAIECLVKPSLSMVLNKLKILKGVSTKIFIVFPSTFVPTFPIDEYAEVLTFEVPQFILNEEKKVGIAIGENLWLELNKRKMQGESFEQVVERLVKVSIGFKEINKCKTIGDVEKLTKEVFGDVQE